MKIAIVADTHNNWANFEKAIKWIKSQEIQLILHCGDVCNQRTVDDALKLFGADIEFVKGNGDWDLEFPDKMEIEVEGKEIAFTHFPDIAKKLAQSKKYDLVFYGHTHRPWDEKIGKTHMINPGELAGQFYKASFAVYDTETEKLELKILEKL